MCLKYLNNVFGSSNRRRNNATDGGASPPPSSANLPQVSLDTVRTAKSAKSIKSSKSAKSAKSSKSATAAASRSPVNVGNQMASSVNNMGSAIKTSMLGESGGGGVLSDAAAATADTVATSAGPVSGSGTGVNERSEPRSSWWGYFGMNKKKKSSIESL